MKYHLRLGTRGSPLARAQVQIVQNALIESRPNLTQEIVIVRTTGDNWAAQPITAGLPTDKGMFTKELEEALLANQIDIAVHSLKDLPVELPAGLEFAALLTRADPRDVLITRAPWAGWDQLPERAVLATGSLRRSAQLRMIRPDLEMVDIRGNIETRLRKLRENPGWHGIILAAAGLDRLHPDLVGLQVTPIDFDRMLPAPGQGVIALQGRQGDQAAATAVVCLHCFNTSTSITAERAFLQALGGGCRAAVGAHARLEGVRLHLEGIYFPDPQQPGRRGVIEGSANEPEALGRQLAAQLLRS